MLLGLDLFSGIGGISLALSDYVRTIGYVEKDKYAQSVLLSRMVTGDIETAPIFRDVSRLDGRKLRGIVDIIFGGFPCQDISVAGNGKGLEGERSGLFFEIIRLVKEINPSFVFLENVPAIRTRGLSEVIDAFTKVGYDCRWTCVTASSVGACHKRDRWFLLANSNGMSLREQYIPKLNKQKIRADSTSLKGDDSISMRERLERQRKESCGVKTKLQNPCGYGRWKSQPTTRGRNHGIQNRVDKLKCLGNSVVPLQVKAAFERLIGR